jgi:hypothetical protein
VQKDKRGKRPEKAQRQREKLTHNRFRQVTSDVHHFNQIINYSTSFPDKSFVIVQ